MTARASRNRWCPSTLASSSSPARLCDRRARHQTHYRAQPQALAPLINWMSLLASGGTHVRMEQSGFRPEDEANDLRAG